MSTPDEYFLANVFRIFEVEPYADKLYEIIEKYLYASDNVVACYELHHIDQTIDDGNGFYISETGLGNIARRNYLHNNSDVFLME